MTRKKGSDSFEREVQRALQTNALAVAAMRAASVHEMLLEEIAECGKLYDNVGDAHNAAMSTMTVNRSTRVATLLTLFYATLNAVVEGWQRPNQPSPRLSNPRIDQLLSQPHTQTLKEYRNAMMHPILLADKRIGTFSEAHTELSVWALELKNLFQEYFRDWQESLRRRDDEIARGAI